MDYGIIGAGISGLYAGYILNQLGFSFLIFEKGSKWGGRVDNVPFAEKRQEVMLGAGVIRATDQNVKELLDHFNIVHYDFMTRNRVIVNSHEAPLNLTKELSEIRNLFKSNQDFTGSLQEFLSLHFPKKWVEDFAFHLGFNDFLYQDVYAALNYAGIDHYAKPENWVSYFEGGWNRLLESLGRPQEHRICLNTEIVQVKKEGGLVVVKDLFGKTYKFKKLIIATDLHSMKKFLEPHLYPLNNILKHFGACSLQRIYVQYSPFSDEQWNTLGGIGMIITNVPLRKIIPINKNGLIMIAYVDGDDLDYFKNMNDYTLMDVTHKELLRIFPILEGKKPLKIITKRWPVGSHYFKPSKKKPEDIIAQNYQTDNNIVVCGEICSLHQGWVEGAIESVNFFFLGQQIKDKILDKKK